jgi:hypothetical protein
MCFPYVNLDLKWRYRTEMGCIADVTEILFLQDEYGNSKNLRNISNVNRIYIVSSLQNRIKIRIEIMWKSQIIYNIFT